MSPNIPFDSLHADRLLSYKPSHPSPKQDNSLRLLVTVAPTPSHQQNTTSVETNSIDISHLTLQQVRSRRANETLKQNTRKL